MQRLKRVFHFDIEHCGVCDGTSRVIACIETPKLIDKILTHLAARNTESRLHPRRARGVHRHRRRVRRGQEHPDPPRVRPRDAVRWRRLLRRSRSCSSRPGIGAPAGRRGPPGRGRAGWHRSRQHHRPGPDPDRGRRLTHRTPGGGGPRYRGDADADAHRHGRACGGGVRRAKPAHPHRLGAAPRPAHLLSRRGDQLAGPPKPGGPDGGVRRSTATRIVVTRRVSTIREAHRIYVLKAGKGVQVGRFDELADTAGPFRDLVRPAGGVTPARVVIATRIVTRLLRREGRRRSGDCTRRALVPRMRRSTASRPMTAAGTG